VSDRKEKKEGILSQPFSLKVIAPPGLLVKRDFTNGKRK